MSTKSDGIAFIWENPERPKEGSITTIDDLPCWKDLVKLSRFLRQEFPQAQKQAEQMGIEAVDLAIHIMRSSLDRPERRWSDVPCTACGKRAVTYNPYNEVVQCHNCGHVVGGYGYS